MKESIPFYVRYYANNIQPYVVGMLFVVLLFLTNHSSATAAITIHSINTTESTCANNGTATVFATSSKADPDLLYQIMDGPVHTAIQNNPTFSSLFPGTYTVRVYDIDLAFKDSQFSITGNYIPPELQPIAINPICPGMSDGVIIGNAAIGTGKEPFTWELTYPYAAGPQLSDTLKNLSEGTYTIKVTDACFNEQSRTTVLVGGGTGLAHGYDGTPFVQKLGCNTVAFSMYIRLFKEKAGMPLKLTIQTDAGTRVTYVYPIPMDIINYVPGYYEIRDTIPNIDYNSYLYACLTDTCGYTICAYKNKVSPFRFDIEYSTIVNCGNKLGAALRLYNPPNYYPHYPNIIYTGFNAPLTVTLRDIDANIRVDSFVCDNNYCNLNIDPQIAGRTYKLRVTDGCGKVFDSTLVWPVLAPPRVETSAGVGCMDSTATGYFNIRNFTSSAKVTLLSGPPSSIVKSSKPHYEFSDIIIYPKTFTPNSFNGLTLKNLTSGDYTYRVWDTCGNEVFGTLTVPPEQLADFNYSYKVKRGCQGSNMLYFDARSSNTVGVYVKNAVTGQTLYERRGFDAVDSIASLPAGKYVLIIYYGYDLLYMGGGVYDGFATVGNPDCWGMYDTITILPAANNAYQSAVTISCNGSSYAEIHVDSARSVPPYQYQLVNSSQTFPYQDSNIFQFPTYGTYNIRIKDACNNSGAHQITVDSAKFPPVIKKGASCTGSRIVLKGVSSAYFSYEWKRPDGSVYVGDSLVIEALSASDTGTYVITKKVTINGCTDTFRSTYHVALSDESKQVIPYCSGTSVHIGTHTYTLPGIYTDTLTNTLGCDSIVHTSLVVLPQKSDTSRVSICKGDHLTVGIHQYTAPGFYMDSVQNAGGCYDLVIIDLNVNGVSDTTRATVCAGFGKASANKMYYTTGIYSDTLTSSKGCDSILVLDLTVLPYKKDSLVQTVCAENGFIMNGRTYTKTGIYRDTLSVNGCDSIVVLNLTVLPVRKDSLARTLCEGQSIVVAGNTYTTTGIYSTIIPTATCDSTVILNLTVLPYKRNTIHHAMCAGDTYVLGTHTYNATGTFTDTLTTTGCDSIVTVVLAVHAMPQVYLGADTSLCTGQSITLEAGNGFASYAWNDGPSSANQHGLTVHQASHYWVHVMDANGCVAADTMEVPFVYPLPTANAGMNDIICAGSSSTLTASGGIQYQWMPGGMQQASVQVSPVVTTTYTVTVTDMHYCTAAASVEVMVYPAPTQPVFANNLLKHCFDEGPVELSAAYGNSFLWTPSGETAQSIQVTQDGTYEVRVWDAYHCFVNARIHIENHCEAALYVPKAFSPNGDGTHDDLEIFGKNFTDFSITIFNRWGEIIFVSTERNHRWDGMYRGEEMPIGSYPWTIHYKSVYDAAHKEQTMEGSITLVR